MFKKEDLSFINFPEKENLRGRFPTYCTKASITLIAKPDRDITTDNTKDHTMKNYIPTN